MHSVNEANQYLDSGQKPDRAIGRPNAYAVAI